MEKNSSEPLEPLQIYNKKKTINDNKKEKIDVDNVNRANYSVNHQSSEGNAQISLP